VIEAPLTYEGKPDYIPQAIAPEPGTDHATIVRYTYNTAYDSRDNSAAITGLVLLSPLIAAAVPPGSNAITVSGLLEVLQDGKPVRTYASVCALKRTYSVFSEGETLTDLRRRGLLLVRDNISAQVCKDQQGLRALLAADQPTNKDQKPQ
jgi:hypothetical protein